MRTRGDDDPTRLLTLAECLELAEETLRNAGSDRLRATAAGSDRLKATAKELISHHDLLEILSVIQRLVREAGGEDLKLNEYLQEEAGNVKALAERIKKKEHSAEAGKTNSENADLVVDPWKNFFRKEKLKHNDWGPSRLADYAFKYRVWETEDSGLEKRSLTQLRRYATEVCKEFSLRNSFKGFDIR